MSQPLHGDNVFRRETVLHSLVESPVTKTYLDSVLVSAQGKTIAVAVHIRDGKQIYDSSLKKKRLNHRDLIDHSLK